MAQQTFTISGDVNVAITIIELDGGNLQFDVKVLDVTGSIGDLNAIFFDLYDDNLTNGLSVLGDDVTGTAFKADGVTKVDNYTNMNGEVVKDLGKFDGGVQFGSQGIGEDDIRETSFVLSHDTADLTLADFNLQDFGVRLTSVGEEGGARDGSLKLGGTMPEPEEPVDPVHTAFDDYLTVDEDEFFFNPDDGSFVGDQLDSGASSVLANDTTDAGAYSGTVTSVNGDAAQVAQIVAGSNGGSLVIYADGTVDFSVLNLQQENDFFELNDGDVAMTTFEYGIEGGDTATVHVTVNGLSDDDGGGVIIDL